jgi:Flp pilus assembly protein TadG
MQRGRGQSLAEFAVILPVFLLILGLGIDFGRMFFTWVQLNNGAREGAAYGISNPNDPSGIQARVLQEINAQSQRGQGTITVGTSCSPSACSVAATAATSNTVTVNVSEPFSFLTPLVGNFTTLTLRASATSVALGAAGVAATAPPCVNVPNVVNMTSAAATSAIEAAGLVPNPQGDLTSGTKDKVASQNPAAATCVTPSTTVVTFHYRP